MNPAVVSNCRIAVLALDPALSLQTCGAMGFPLIAQCLGTCLIHRGLFKPCPGVKVIHSIQGFSLGLITSVTKTLVNALL